jgi:Na+/H+ antiporter NhaD/arsenite permease-like protein
MAAMKELGLYAFLSVMFVMIFTYRSVQAYLANQRNERDAYYRNELLKKLADTEGGAQAVVAALKEADREKQSRTQKKRRSDREGVKLGGLITTGVGVGMLVFLQTVGGPPVGAIPLCVGLAMLAYAYLLAPKDEAAPNGDVARTDDER